MTIYQKHPVVSKLSHLSGYDEYLMKGSLIAANTVLIVIV